MAPGWLRKVMGYDKAEQALNDTNAAALYLSAVSEAVNLLAKTSYTDPQQASAQEAMKDCLALLNRIAAKGSWYMLARRKQLQAQTVRLIRLQMELLQLALPKVKAFTQTLIHDCDELDRQLRLLQRKGWEIMPALNLLSLVRKIVRDMNTEEPQIQDLCETFRAYQVAEEAAEAVEMLQAEDAMRTDIRQFLRRYRTEHPKRLQRLAVEFAALKRFKHVCASWKDIEEKLVEARGLLDSMRKQFNPLQRLIDNWDPAQAATLQNKLKDDWARVKALYDECAKSRAERRKQIDDASRLVRRQLERAQLLAKEPGAANADSLQVIKAFVDNFRKALKDNGDLLTAQAMADQANLIVEAVNALQANPHTTVTVAVHDEFARLDDFSD